MFDFRDFNLIGTRNSVAVCDIESFSLTAARLAKRFLRI